jgi:stearoyl-CoA desaturase (delta-9 desaturase)
MPSSNGLTQGQLKKAKEQNHSHSNGDIEKEIPAKFEWNQVVWYNVIILALWHLGSLYSLFLVIPKAPLMHVLVLWGVLWIASGLGITAGAHRLWAHRSYRAKAPLKAFLMLCNSMAFQGSIFEWSRDHRVHHKGSDTNADPHNATRGFFFAHMGWVMVRKHPNVSLFTSPIGNIHGYIDVLDL